MKLVLAIVNNDDSAIVSSALTKDGFFVTKLSTTGGFLMVGNTTLLIGTEDDRIDALKQILGQYCSTRTKSMPSTDAFGRINGPQNTPKNVVVGGATYFVLDVSEYGKL
jgi:uncharacterized protein YaaQ